MGVIDQVRYFLKSGNNSAINIHIDSIPEEWEFFSDSKDKWRSVKLEDVGLTGCLYHAVDGSEFFNHFHKNIEFGFVIRGRVIIYLPNSKPKTYNKGEWYRIAGGEENRHIVEFEEVNNVESEDDIYSEEVGAGGVILLLLWMPKFPKGWDGVFTKKAK